MTKIKENPIPISPDDSEFTKMVNRLIECQGLKRVVLANALMKSYEMSVDEVCEFMDGKEATKTT